MKEKEEFVIFNNELIDYTGKSKHVQIPNGVTAISFRTFYGSDICSVKIPQSVEFIDVQAFLCCNNLKYVVIPKSVKGMEYAVFEDCINLKDIFLETEKDNVLGFDWDYGCKASLHYAGEWEYKDGVPMVKEKLV